MRNRQVFAILLAGAGLVAAAPPPGPSLAGTYASPASRIVGTELVEGKAFAVLQHLTDRIGPRLSGSAGADAAVRWTIEHLRADGFDARAEAISVPVWVRGEERAEIIGPAAQKLVVTALGGSVPTPEGGLTAEVIEADGLDTLKSLEAAKVRGRIVLFNRVMAAGATMAGYEAVAVLRRRGPAEAARLGAAACLVRSLGTLSARLPHTGTTSYAAEVPRIPAAAITAEDADLIHRFLAAGETVRLRLRLGCRTLPDAPSANVVADLKGREKPEEVVLVGAHLDSWDLGTGAIDDGAGSAMVMETLRLLKSLSLAPRRTIRGVLFMNEENGLRGGRGYALAHGAELAHHVAALEADAGAGSPLGFSVTTGEGGLETVREIAGLLGTLGATDVTEGGGGADIGPLRSASVPLLGLRNDATHYFDWHHTAADTLDKVLPQELAQSTAALAVMTYVLADMPEPLPRPALPDPSARPTPF